MFNDLNIFTETRTPLLTHRQYDSSTAGLPHWPFMSVHNWGENPEGDWQITIMDDVSFGIITQRQV